MIPISKPIKLIEDETNKDKNKRKKVKLMRNLTLRNYLLNLNQGFLKNSVTLHIYIIISSVFILI